MRTKKPIRGGSNTGFSILKTKWTVELNIRRIGIPATALRPVAFMENFGTYFTHFCLAWCTAGYMLMAPSGPVWAQIRSSPPPTAEEQDAPPQSSNRL